jgi:hypothetical protein
MTGFFLSLWLTLTLMTPIPDNFILVDQTGQMDKTIIRETADPLLEQGARVAIFVVSDEESFELLLTQHGLMTGQQLLPEVIAIRINSSSNTTEIRYGVTWRNKVGRHAASIYENRLAAGVMTGAYNAGVVNTLNEIVAVTQGDRQTSLLPGLSPVVVMILAAGLLLIGLLAWLIIRPQLSHKIHFS